MRTLSTAFRNAIEASASGEVVLVFATITHANLAATIRVVSEDDNGVSFLNSLVVNYKYGGNLFVGCPFSLDLLTDDDRPPRGRVSMFDVDRVVSLQVLPLIESPRIKLEILKLSDFSAGVDGSNSRTPTGTPTVEYAADHLYLRNCTGGGGVIQAEIQSFDLVGEPWPLTRATQDRLPGLFF